MYREIGLEVSRNEHMARACAAAMQKKLRRNRLSVRLGKVVLPHTSLYRAGDLRLIRFDSGKAIDLSTGIVWTMSASKTNFS